MVLFGNIRCVTFPELLHGGILSKPNYDKKVREGKLRVVRPGKGAGCCALIEYNTMPETIKMAYNEIYPDVETELKQQLISNMLRVDSEAIAFYRKYELADGSGLTDKIQAEYVLNAQVLNEMKRVAGIAKSAHAKNGVYRPTLAWQIAYETCEKLREAYKHTLPLNKVRLREKFNQYKKNGYGVLVSKKNGNKNTQKIGVEESRLILKLRRSKLPIYTDAQIYEEYNRQAIERGLNPIKSMTTLRNFLNDPAIAPLWWGTVYGMQKFKARYSSLQKTSLPQMRDSLWYSDGTKLNLFYKNPEGKMCTTSVYEVMDAYSEVFLGYDIAPNEDFRTQYRAYRMAVQIAGHRPYEIVTDNQGGHTKLAADGFFKNICILHRPTMAYNGQSKTIESAFGRFQTQILHKIWHFTGQNVQAKKLNSKPNIEFIEQNAYALPTLEEVKAIYHECREEWNNGKHPATGLPRMEMYSMSENAETTPISEIEMRQMFWIKSRQTVTYRNSGLKIEINKQKYEFDVYGENGLRNEAWALKNTGRSFRVVYDPMNLTRVELWVETASGLKYSTDATPKVVISRATQERTSEETSFMRRTIEQNKQTMALAQLTMDDFDMSEAIAAELFGLSTPRIKTISKKSMEEYRIKYDTGELISPISVPSVEMEINEEDVMTEYSTLGEYTKALSNMTNDEVSRLERF